MLNEFLPTLMGVLSPCVCALLTWLLGLILRGQLQTPTQPLTIHMQIVRTLKQLSKILPLFSTKRTNSVGRKRPQIIQGRMQRCGILRKLFEFGDSRYITVLGERGWNHNMFLTSKQCRQKIKRTRETNNAINTTLARQHSACTKSPLELSALKICILQMARISSFPFYSFRRNDHFKMNS